ncbi:HIRAN domain-containing protein [Pseudonocardia zijingensis]
MEGPRPVRERVAEFVRGEVTRRTCRTPAELQCTEVVLWSRKGWANQEVVGERAHFEALRSVVGSAHRPMGAEHHVIAALVPEPTNRFDVAAVAVYIDGKRVGYLPREDARRYRPVLDQIEASGRRPTVTARIWAADYEDWDADRDETVARFGAGVYVELDEPHLLLPINSAPIEPHVLLPDGSTIQVQDTAAHLERLAGIAGADGERWAYATLHTAVEQRARSTRELAEVRVDGERVGKLTPKMSDEVLPVVRFLAERGRATASRLLVSGNRAAVSARLYVARAHQIDDRWFDEAL